MFLALSKYIKLDYSFVHENLVVNTLIINVHLPPVDTFTKSLSTFRSKLGVHNHSIFNLKRHAKRR